MYLSKNNIIIELDKDTQLKYVLLNSRFGNVNLLDDDYYNYIQGLQKTGRHIKEEPEKIDRLKQRGYLYQDENEEIARAKEMMDNLYKLQADSNRHIYKIIPQSSCSMGCSYCKFQDMTDKRMMSEEDLEKIMDYIINLEKQAGLKKQPALFFYGCEGLPDNEQGFAVVKKVLENYIGHFCKIIFFTFGFNLQRYKDLIAAVDHKKLSFVFYLLQNEDSRAGDHEVLSRENELCIDWLRISGIPTGLFIKITEDNVDKMPNYVNYFIEKGHLLSSNCSIQFKPVHKHDCMLFNPCAINYGLYEKIFKIYGEYPQMESAKLHGNGIINILLQLIKSRGRFAPAVNFCQASSNLLVFDAAGDIFACHHAVNYPQLAVGNISNEEIIDESKLGEWRSRNTGTIEECIHCPGRYLCGGGCAFEALVKKNSISKPVCQPYQNLIKWAFESLHDDFLESPRYNQVHEEYAKVSG